MNEFVSRLTGSDELVLVSFVRLFANVHAGDQEGGFVINGCDGAVHTKRAAS